MHRALVWDLPTRVLHWLFTASIVGAVALVATSKQGSPGFHMHMLLGMLAGFLLVLRVAWGLVGSRYARFRSFLFGPGALLRYLRGVFRRDAERYAGHNPGSAYAVYVMLILGFGLCATGVLMPTWEGFEELHGPMAFGLVLTVVAHLVGMAVYTVRHREHVALSMVHGKKQAEAGQGIPSAHALVGVVVLALAAGWTALLFSGYDAQAGQVTLLGQTVKLGQAPSESHHEREDRHGEHHGDHD